MRNRRIKVDAGLGEATYHVMTRTVNGERLLDDVAKEVLRKQLWQVAEFTGVEILTYALMANHFHVLVRVPQRRRIDDAELLRRYQVLYPKPTRYQLMRHEVIVEKLKANDEEGIQWRERQLALMGDVSQFMKLLKQRFSVWFNRSHDRYGTLWAERFKSVLIESDPRMMQVVAAYIDLNPVRANIVQDPKDYRFSGYGEAVAGRKVARAGLIAITNGRDWRTVQEDYRQTLYGWGADPRNKGHVITSEELKKVVKAKGKLPAAAVIRCRVRYFSDGAVLGSREFVGQHLRRYAEQTGRRRGLEPKTLPGIDGEAQDWTTLRGLRNGGFG